jgi:putative SOS response-associated peptidase YedK
MCGRFIQYSDPEVYASHFDLDEACAATPRYNLAPTQSVLVVLQAQGRGRVLVPLRWGLVPAWSKGPDNRHSMINARAETVDTKPAYRHAFKHRRCLIPAEGFYEWRSEQRGKTPFLIRRRDGAPFGMAGLWETWHGPEGERLDSCTIVVTAANDLVAAIHDRMPAVVAPEDYGTWLDPDTKGIERLRAMLRPADPEAWELRAVSRQVNSPKNDGPDLIEPVGPV